jgi:hypothetical protein
MPILDETDQLILEYHYESVTLKEKSTGNILFADDFYGEPSCGLIDKEQRWAMIAVEFLVDPWSAVAAVWQINLSTFELTKIRDFDAYKTREYVDEVVW